MRRVEVDFNMTDMTPAFVAVSDELRVGQVFLAQDQEGHEMASMVVEVRGNHVLYVGLGQ